MRLFSRILSLLIGLVWLLNGLWAKLLHGVPRHEAIVARFFGMEAAHFLTALIGIAETAVGVWWLSGYRRRLNASLQIAAVASMNTLEALCARDLLLWGGWNAAWAALFCTVVACCGFFVPAKPTTYAVLS